MKCDSQSFIQKVNGLCNLIASKPHLPLWRCDRLHSSWYIDYDPGLGACFQAALDVKSCVRLLQSPAEKPIYRSFWPRLLAVDRRWLNRLRMLSDASFTDPWQAVDPCARPCLVRCAQLWLWALCPQGDPSFWVHSRLLQRQQLEELCSEVDSGLVGLLMMSKLMPGLQQDWDPFGVAKSCLTLQYLHVFAFPTLRDHFFICPNLSVTSISKMQTI